MAQQNINLGTEGQKDGDLVRDAFQKAEANFTELYNLVGNEGTFTPVFTNPDLTALESYYSIRGQYCHMQINGTWLATASGMAVGYMDMPQNLTIRNYVAGKLVGSGIGNPFSNTPPGAIMFKHGSNNTSLRIDINQTFAGTRTYYFSVSVVVEIN